MALPEKFVGQVLRDLGQSEGRALCAALESEPTVAVRLNPAKTGVGIAEAGQAEAPTLSVMRGADGRVPWCGEGWYLAVRPQFTLDSDFHAGAYYVQEPSSQAVEYLLRGACGAEAGEAGSAMAGEAAASSGIEGRRILDLCAAPGGKTTLYASMAGPGGLVVANEVDRRRAQALVDNVRKWGTGNVVVTSCEARRVCDFEAWFDVVAVDAPCSGEGMFRKDLDARSEWSEGNVKLCAARQNEILREAWRALKPGGTLIYSTCTFNREENELTLERMLLWAGDEVVEATEAADADEVLKDVVRDRVGAFRTCRFYPHRARGEGFFAAVARKAFDAGGRSRKSGRSNAPARVLKGRREILAPVDRAAQAELRRWVRRPEGMVFASAGDTCYGWYGAQAEAVKTLAETLPVIYSGVAMGQMFKGRLKPDAALALFCGLNREALAVAHVNRDEALAFLRRQELEAGIFAEGLNLLCAEGRALGFAKRIGARVNNLYPMELRIRMND